MWHSLDDNQVVQVSEKVVLEQKAYMLFYVRDRRNIAPRRLVNIIGKENILQTVAKNKDQLVSVTNLKEMVRNDPNVRWFSTSDCSPGYTQMDESSRGSLKELNVKNAFVANMRLLAVPETSSLSKDPPVQSSSKEVLEVHHSISGPFVAEGTLDSASFSVMSNHSISRPTVVTDDLKGSLDKLQKESRKELSVPIVTSTNCSGSERSIPENHVPKRLTLENIGVTVERCLNAKVGRMKNPTFKEIGLVETSNHFSLLDGYAEKEVHVHHPKEVLKRKKLMKCRTASLHLGSKLLFKESLILYKKRKLKKYKKRYSKLKSFTQQGMEEGAIGLGPSTSEETNVVPSNQLRPEERRKNSVQGKEEVIVM